MAGLCFMTFGVFAIFLFFIQTTCYSQSNNSDNKATQKKTFELLIKGLRELSLAASIRLPRRLHCL